MPFNWLMPIRPTDLGTPLDGLHTRHQRRSRIFARSKRANLHQDFHIVVQSSKRRRGFMNYKPDDCTEKDQERTHLTV